ncbi:protein crumbs-like isoform X2 [Mytilus trossulus]|uniref:protein crumbs-like isoform X2 n=1 Tax=Mytilus trossulus TaxID=6551 RepID=UPI00300408ED
MDSYNTVYKGSDDIQMSRLVNEEDDYGTQTLLKDRRKWKTLSLALGLLSFVCIIAIVVLSVLASGKVSQEENKTETSAFQQGSSCGNQPCFNGGLCKAIGDNFTCTCSPGYSGSRCEVSVCDSNPCSNGGLCQVKGDKYKCTCDPGFSGDQCDVGPCDGSPCLNGGTCDITGNTHSCTCVKGFSGRQCQSTPCDNQPCFNGGLCKSIDDNFTCTCQTGYSGYTCEVGLCDNNPCLNDGTCYITGNTQSCSCLRGISGGQCQTCGRAKVDIVIILDTSTSVGPVNLQKMKKFCKDFLTKADLGSENIQVGIVSFSFVGRIEFHLNTYSSSQDIIKAIDAITYRHGSTNTFGALKTMRSQMFTAANGDRDGVPNVVLILIDGVSNVNSARTIPEAERARSEGIHIYAVGIGLRGFRELNAIASRPASENSFNVQNFDELAALNDKVFRAFCSDSG